MLHVGDTVIQKITGRVGTIVGQYEQLFLVRFEDGMSDYCIARELRKV